MTCWGTHMCCIYKYSRSIQLLDFNQAQTTVNQHLMVTYNWFFIDVLSSLLCIKKYYDYKEKSAYHNYFMSQLALQFKRSRKGKIRKLSSYFPLESINLSSPYFIRSDRLKEKGIMSPLPSPIYLPLLLKSLNCLMLIICRKTQEY